MAEKGATVLALQTAMIPKEFWAKWEEMDERSRTAVMLGNMAEMNTRLGELEERVSDLEEADDN